jgi:hypothetical protein
MDHCVAREILRLDRLEQRACAHQQVGILTSNTDRAMRAVRLQTAVHARMMAIVGGEVTTYSDCS